MTGGFFFPDAIFKGTADAALFFARICTGFTAGA